MSATLSRKYLNRQFAWAALGFLAALTLMFIACWTSVTRFMASSQYESVFSRLLAENVRLETELTLILANDREPSARDIARLRDAYRNLAGLYWLLASTDAHVQSPEQVAEFETIIRGALGPDTHLDDLLYVDGRPLNLESRDMPSSLDEIWHSVESTGAPGKQRSLSVTVLNILNQVGPIIAERAGKSATLGVMMEHVLNTEFPHVRPLLRELSHFLSEETDRSRRQVIMFLGGLIAICVLAVLVIWRAVFTPLTHTILEAQDNLEEERDRALNAERAKADFLAVMSHELRTPMNAVIGFTNLLSQSKLDKHQKEFVDTILGSSEALLSILNDVLDFSKIEAGKIELESEDFSLEDVIGNTIDILGPTAYAKNLELLSFVDPNLPRLVSGDPGRLRQILFNLVGNAIKFTSEGSVAVEVRPGKMPGRTIDAVEIAVVDTGIGISKDVQQAIFDRFTQADSSTTRKFGGTGLGLAISRRLTQLMDGDLTVDSEEGDGSTFRVLLPLLASSPPSKPIADTQDILLHGYKFLVVDDNDQNRRFFGLMLEGYGAEVVLAEDAGRAMSYLLSAQRSDAPFDAVILDHMMPDIDGVELARMVRGVNTLLDLPLILSSSAHQGELTSADSELFDGICPKPIRQRELVRLLGTCIEEAEHRQSQPVEVVAAQVEVAAEPKSKETPQETEPSQQESTGNTIQADSITDETLAEDVAKPTDTGVARILLADDHVPNQRLISAFLAKMPFSVDMANNGLEAVQFARTLPYDIILMDVNMPEMSGIEATERIRSTPNRNSSTPIIAVTANVLPGDKDKYLKVGMDDYITKPITLEALKERLDYWGSRQHAPLPDEKAESASA